MRRNKMTLFAALCLAGIACEKKPTTPGEAPAPGQAAAPENGPKDKPAGETPPPVGADTILLGEVGSLTGGQATFGISTRNGIELAIEETNAAGGVKGKKIEVRVYDDQGKAEEAANATTRLIAQDKVKIILGEVASTNSLAMAAKAQAAQIPMITPSSTSPKVTEVGDFIFRVCFIDPFQGAVMAKFASETLKAKNIAILKDQKSDYSIGLTEVFTATFTQLGGKIVATEAYAQGDTDFRSQLTVLKGKKPDAIYVPGYYTDVGLVARQARELGIKATLLGGDGWESERLFELGGAALEGAYYSNHYSADDPSQNVQRFLQSYKEKYGALPDSLSALGYDAAMVAIEALRRATDLSGPAIRDAIAATKDFQGVAGKITLDANRNAVKPAVVLQVADGRAKYVTSVNP